jgi:hypothetical protein
LALKTAGTSATTTLNAFVQGTNTLIADVASIQQAIKNDMVNGNPIYPGAFEFALGGDGLLYIPNRGVLNVFPGDYVMVDPNGWPILVSKHSIAGSGWTHS